MSDTYLDSFNIKFLSKIYSSADRFATFTRQSKYEVAMHNEPELLGVFGELPCTLDGRALLDVLQDLRIARFIPHDQQSAAGFALRFQRFVVRSHARRATPGQVQRLQLRAQLHGARLLDIERVVVKEIFLHPRTDRKST